jgi:hypothetical protein
LVSFPGLAAPLPAPASVAPLPPAVAELDVSATGVFVLDGESQPDMSRTDRTKPIEARSEERLCHGCPNDRVRVPAEIMDGVMEFVLKK